jgi:3-hydroxyisobutyrate dehydrogenase-like beta-hydroxyacid dehydrogenase
VGLLASSLSGMEIAIIGSGKMGRGFATALSRKHKVVLGSRDPERAAKVVRATGAAGAATYEEAAAGRTSSSLRCLGKQ